MKLFALTALLASAQAVSLAQLNNQDKLYSFMQTDLEAPPAAAAAAAAASCPEPLEMTEEEMHYQLGEFSRNFQQENWDNAQKILADLKSKGKNPKYAVTTKELYDHSFSFPKVRNYDYAIEQMSMLENVEDNLNKNITNNYHFTRFLEVAKQVRANLNRKYDIGFMDPGVEGDWQ